MAPFSHVLLCGFWPGMQRDIGCRPGEYFRSNRESDGKLVAPFSVRLMLGAAVAGASRSSQTSAKQRSGWRPRQL